MTIATGPLALLAFPQEWNADSRKLRIRFLCLPMGNPFDELAPGKDPFVDAKLEFEARLIVGLANAPQSASSHAVPLQVPKPKYKRELFTALESQISVDPRAPRKRADRPIFRKAAPDSYRSVTGDRRLSEYMVSEKDFECALHEAHGKQDPALADPDAGLRWGQIVAFAVRQPALATALGLISEAEFDLPSDGFFKDGGWLYVGLKSGGTFPIGLGVSHAARIPALTNASRYIFTAVLFPIDSSSLPLDDIFTEAQQYDTGHAQLVHGRQTKGETDGDAIQLSWDDEQVAEWLNRTASLDNSAPMGTAGYRVDVRKTGGQWNSLQKIRSLDDLELGGVNLGRYTGEAMVEVVPVRLLPDPSKEYWMPPYFATWRGTSLVLTDSDLAGLHRTPSITVENDSTDPRLNRDIIFKPVDDKNVPLRYGNSYDFRVRLADLTGGGPPEGAPLPSDIDANDNPTATVAFRRSKPPGPVAVIQRPTRARKQLVIGKPRLGYPEILYTNAGVTFGQLTANLTEDIKANRQRGLGRPDPDVTRLRITVCARGLSGDRVDWFEMYETERDFGNEGPLPLAVRYIDRPSLLGFPKATKTGALPMPTARDVRIVLTALGSEDPHYWINDDVRKGPPVTVELHAVAANEPALGDTPELVSFFMRQPPSDGSVPRPAERLATELELDHHDLTIAGRARQRTVIGCSAQIRHTLSPERSAITLSADTDTTNQWIHALRFSLARDWTWRGLAEDGIEVYRRIQRGSGPKEAEQLVGTVSLPTALSPNATTDTDKDIGEDRRQTTQVVFFDAHDPKPEPGKYPTELSVRYTVRPRFESGKAGIPLESPVIRLPLTTPPLQVPKLLSAGIAFRDDDKVDPDEVDEKLGPRAALWFEFAEPCADRGDAFFVRPLIAAPDPVLTDEAIPETPEPVLPIDPEWMRLIHVGQATDTNGALAMQPLARSAKDGQCYLVPLPDGVDETSPDLFSMYTYEIRVGHADQRWSTANGRWGSPLRVTGVRHPPPQLYCQAARTKDEVLVRAPFATPTLLGRPVGPRPPKTRLWALLYARVQQADAEAWRHLLLDNAPLSFSGSDNSTATAMETPVLYGQGSFQTKTVERRLCVAGLPEDAELAVLAVEFYTEPEVTDPLGDHLGQAPFIRTSELVPVPDAC